MGGYDTIRIDHWIEICCCNCFLIAVFSHSVRVVLTDYFTILIDINGNTKDLSESGMMRFGKWEP